MQWTHYAISMMIIILLCTRFYSFCDPEYFVGRIINCDVTLRLGHRRIGKVRPT